MSKYIAPYITRKEYECPCCHAVPPDFDLENLLEGYNRLFQDFANARREYGGPIPITSGYRCTDYQMRLYEQGVSSTPYSAHIFGMALDLDCKNRKDVMRLLSILREINPHLRIGYKRYLYRGQTFIHIDNAYFLHPRFSPKFRKGARW